VNAPLIWIGLPLAVSVGLFLIFRRPGWATAVSAGVCLVLALLAWQAPIDTLIQIGPLNIKISSEIFILGRRFVLADDQRSFLTLVYMLGAAWFFGAVAARPGRLFWPAGMGFIALLVAAQAVEPFLYAALLIEMAVLLSVPMLNPPGRSVGQGTLRYLIFQTLALPFILLSGWMATAIEATPNDPRLLIQAAILFGLGFAFWLAVFPFNTWVPLLTGEAHPYTSGFVLSFLPGVALFLALGFMDSYTWLRDNPNLPNIFQVISTIMVVTGGVGAAVQKDLKRAFGYAVILESGFSLLALGLRTTVGLQAFASLLMPRFLALLLFSFALSIFEQSGIPATLEGIQGSLRRLPFASVGLLVAYFSLGGLPLLAEFPVRQALIEAIAGQSLTLLVWVLFGSLSFWAGGFRLMALMASNQQSEWKIEEKSLAVILLSLSILAVFFIGLLPGVFLPGFQDLIHRFSHLL
jgi:NADH:ubiquinone oxidoreductase subunit 2 (subunit N)